VSASRHLHDLLAQLNKEVAVERLAEAQGVTLDRDEAGYRGVPDGWRAHGLCACDVCEELPWNPAKIAGAARLGPFGGNFLAAEKTAPPCRVATHLAV
jgi:hypothetical protein